MKRIWIVITTQDDKTGQKLAYATTTDTKSSLYYLLGNKNIVNLAIPLYDHAARDLARELNEKYKRG